MERNRPGTDLLNDPAAWGRKLILTQDHDPLYVGLTRWGVPGSRLRRFMLAYWCCYSVGASWWLSHSSGSRFWGQLRTAAENLEPSPINGRWPRAHERRHWRGRKCVDSVTWLASSFKHPEEAVLSLEGAASLEEVNRLMDWPQFGPWIAFKAADMLERVLGCRVRFPDEVITLYRDPREGAEMAQEVMGLNSPQDAVLELLDAYADLQAPGYGGTSARPVNIQEVETVLCKWKSARKGHYWIGLDTRDHCAQLSEWEAHDLLDAYPRLPG